MDEITDSISRPLPNGMPTCRNALIIKYMNSRGIPCCGVAALDIQGLVKKCFGLNIDMIISYRTDPAKPFGHFSVVTGYDEEFIYVNDPSKNSADGSNLPIRFAELKEMMTVHPDGREVVMDGTVILLADPKADANTGIRAFNINGEPSDTLIFTDIENDIGALIVLTQDDGIWVRKRQPNQPPPPAV